jgi:hypothetical protein
MEILDYEKKILKMTNDIMRDILATRDKIRLRADLQANLPDEEVIETRKSEIDKLRMRNDSRSPNIFLSAAK